MKYMRILIALSLILLVSFAHADTIPAGWVWEYGENHLQLSTNNSQPAPIGFDFSFYGDSFNTAHISGNGYLGFGPGVLNRVYPGDWPLWSWQQNYSKIAAALWMQFNASPHSNFQTKTHYNTIGAAGSRVFVVTWLDTPDAAGGRNTFQMRMFEGTNTIQMSYLALPAVPDPTKIAPVGLNFGDGSLHASFQYNVADNPTFDGFEAITPNGSLQGRTLQFNYEPATGNYVMFADINYGDGNFEHVPEPGTWALMGIGVVGLALYRRRTAKAQTG